MSDSVLTPDVAPVSVADQQAEVAIHVPPGAVDSLPLNGIAVTRDESHEAVASVSEYPRWPFYLMALGAALAMVKWAQPFLVPVVMAVLIFYALVLAVDALERWHVPRALGAALVVLALIAATTATMWAVWAQLDRIAEAVPRAVGEMKTRYSHMKYDQDSTLSKLQGGADALQRAISTDIAPGVRGGANRPPTPTATPTASGNGVFERFAWSGTVTLLEMLSTLAAIYLLAYFLLVEGDNFRRKWMGFGGKALSTRRVTVQALNAIDLSVRRYLAMLLLTNAFLGLVTYVALRLLGVEDAAGWGVLAGLLHIIPYFGPMLVAGGVFVTSLHQLGDVQAAFVAALATIAVATVIGTFAQTWMTARIAKMSASVVFISILLFGWLWGGAGLLLAVPIAVIAKVIMNAVPSLNPLGQLLGDGRRKK